MSRTPSRSILISGASIAGPTLAWWLSRHGFDVTVVECAATMRSGGYPIDIRGTALDVVERMGLLPQVRAEHIGMRRISFVDARGRVLGVIPPEELTGSDVRACLRAGGTVQPLSRLLLQSLLHAERTALEPRRDRLRRAGPRGRCLRRLR